MAVAGEPLKATASRHSGDAWAKSRCNANNSAAATTLAGTRLGCNAWASRTAAMPFTIRP